MATRPASPSPAAPAAPAADSPAAGWSVLAVAAVVALGALVWHRAAGYFFSQDDFAGLARAQQLAPRLVGPWRWLSGQAYFDVMRPIAGHHAVAYHLMSVGAHLATATLLFRWLERRLSRAAALAGAVAFVTHPMPFTAVYSISGIGEILALGLALGAMLCLERPGRIRWLAPPLFALSLLSKESTWLLPGVAWLALRAPSGAGRAGRAALPPLVGMAALAVAYGVSFVGADAFSVRRALPEMAAYSLAFDGTLVRNALTYLGWTLNAILPTVRHFTDAPDAESMAAGALALALWLAGLAWRPLRARGWLAAGLLYLAFLLPVLPLRNHVYHYYLYAPLAGAAWCLAMLVDALPGRFGAGRPAVVPALALSAVLALNGYLLVRKIEFAPFTVPELRSDATVDRARIARLAVQDLGAAGLPAKTRLAFWAPTLVAPGDSAAHDPEHATYFERNVRAALLEGLAVRVMFPQVDSVVFVRGYRSLPEPWRYAVYRLDGSLAVAPSAVLDTVLRHFPGAAGSAPGPN